MSKIAIINDFHTEYTTATYFLEFLQENCAYVKAFKPHEQYDIPAEYTTRIYIDGGTDYYIYPAQNTKKILYIIDTHTRKNMGKELCQFADIVFCAQKNAVDTLKLYCPSVYWLPLGCSEKWHHSPVSTKLYDVGFIGGINDSKRGQCLEALKDKYGERSYIGCAEKSEIGKIYSSSRIVFNLSTNNDINMRFFEAMCSGALLVTDNIASNGMEELTRGRDSFCVFYDDFDDALSKIDYYLEHEEERADIARRGKDFAMEATYAKRMMHMLELSETSIVGRKHSLLSYILCTLRTDLNAGGLVYAAKRQIKQIAKILCA